VRRAGDLEELVSIRATYVHTNLVAADWRALAAFYQELFGCVPVPPERDYQGDALDAGTGLVGTHLCGAHLRLPGRGDDGPTLEIFTHDPLAERGATAVNHPGFGHVAFEVDDVAAARDAVLGAGGSAVGEVVTLQTASGAMVTWCYVTDPEGNIIELQSWTAASDAEPRGRA
jgi:predicted enzyme related to lactoylglutathione lyase